MPDQTAETMRPMTAEETRQALDFEMRVRREFSIQEAIRIAETCDVDSVIAAARKIEGFLKNG